MTMETIKHEGKILAIVVKTSEIKDKIFFVSPENFPMQVGVQNREKGVLVDAHEHLPFDKLENVSVQEIFYIKSGKAQVGIYSNDKKIADRMISDGDLIILDCGHSVRFLEDTSFIEIKQGPYRGRENEKREIK